LIGLDLGKHCTKALVGHDFALSDTPLPLKGSKGEGLAAIAELETTIGVLVHPTVPSTKPLRLRDWIDEIETTAIAQG
jgi:hypothetical protein